jgi:hypothetical protein
LLVTLSPTQLAFATSLDPFPAFVGGFGSGKTAAAIARTMALKIQEPNCDLAYYLPTYSLVEDIAFKRFPELLERRGYAHKIVRSGSPCISFPGRGKIIFRTMERPERIVGYEVAHSVVDELDTLPLHKARDLWNKVIARNRQKGTLPNTVAVATTPEGFRFVYDRWVKNGGAGYKLFKARTIDNAANLPEGYIENLQASYPPALLSAYLDGEFVNLTGGAIYAEFDRQLNQTFETAVAGEPIHIGMDFNVMNMSAVVCVMRNGVPHFVDEITGARDTPQMIEIIRNRYAGHQIFIYPDASGSATKSVNASLSDITLLRTAGFTVLAHNRNPSIKDRVLAVNQMILRDGERRLFVNPDKCPSLIECLERQIYAKNGEPDKSAGFDHLNDAIGYLIAYKYGIGRGTVSFAQISGV